VESRGEQLSERVTLLTGQLRACVDSLKTATVTGARGVLQPGLEAVREFHAQMQVFLGPRAARRLSSIEHSRCADAISEFLKLAPGVIESLQRVADDRVREAVLKVRGEDSTDTRKALAQAAELAEALDRAAIEITLQLNEAEHLLRHRRDETAPPPALPPVGKVDRIRSRGRKRRGMAQHPLLDPYIKRLPDGKSHLPKKEYTPRRRVGTKLVAERFQTEDDIFECEQCGGGMTERVRKGGVNLLVCGYCGHERELSAPAKAPVAWHDFSAAKQNLSALLKPAEGITSWTCNECGAEVDSASEKMVGRCAYCGSRDFVRLDVLHGVLQPQGLQRFACDAERAEWLLRQWLKRRRDAVAKFHSEFSVVAVEARYVPYWILDIVVPARGSERPVVTIRNVHACASRQILQRMPSELRAVEPFETRMLPPFEPEQLAGTVCERFTVDLDEAWSHVQRRVKDRIDAELAKSWEIGVAASSAEISFKYLMLPVYFFVLDWNGTEYHALMDGAGDGVGIQYPRSHARVLKRRAMWAAGLLAIIALCLTAAILAERRAEEHERFEQQQLADFQAEVNEHNRKVREYKELQEAKERERKRKQAEAEAAGIDPDKPEPVISEAEKARRALAAAPVEERSWFSDPFDVSLPLKASTKVEAEGTINLRLRVQLEVSASSVQALEYVKLLHDADRHLLLHQAAVAGVEEKAYYEPTGPDLDRDARFALQDEISSVLGLKSEGGYWPWHALSLINLTPDAKPLYTGTFHISLNVERHAGNAQKLLIELKMDPLRDPERFCELTSEYRIDYKCWVALRDFMDGSGNVDKAGALPKLQETLDALLRDKLGGEWVGNVTVTALRD